MKFTVLAATLATVSAGACNKEFTMKQLEKHNELRRKHGVPDMTFDQAACESAQDVSDDQARMGQMAHSAPSRRNNCGENIYWFWSSQPIPNPVAHLGSTPTQAWYDEVKDYNFAAPGFNGATGHFTQVVWKSSTRLGCGINGSYVTCHYCPAGNYMGQFPQNVLPPVNAEEQMSYLEMMEIEEELNQFII